MQRQILRNHPSLILHNDIAQICAPLFKNQAICILNFIRLHKDGTASYLCDNHSWIKYYLLNGFHDIGAFEHNSDLQNTNYVTWDILHAKDPIVQYSRQAFNIKHGITLVRKHLHGHDFFNFGINNESRAAILNLLSNIDVLNNFIDLFYNKAKKLIETIKNNSFDLHHPENHNSTFKIPNRIFLGPEYNYQYLTKTEISCLNKMIKGINIPTIAKLVNVSPRTLEKHVENIKIKLGCSTQCELGYVAAKLNIDELGM